MIFTPHSLRAKSDNIVISKLTDIYGLCAKPYKSILCRLAHNCSGHWRFRAVTVFEPIANYSPALFVLALLLSGDPAFTFPFALADVGIERE